MMKDFHLRHILLGGCLLAFGAAFVNVGFLMETGASVSHLTGDITKLAASVVTLSEGHFNLLIVTFLATVGFLIGAALSGYILHHPRLEIKVPYGRTLFVLGLFLIIADRFLLKFPLAAVTIGSMVCGFQNALANRWNGIVLRTTHLTGLLTDLGIFIGMHLRGHAVESFKLLIPLLLVIAYFSGACFGALFVFAFKMPWLLVSGIAYSTGGITWSILKRTLDN